MHDDDLSVIFADLHRIEDAAPTAFEVEDRHIKRQQWIVPTTMLPKIVPQLIS
jgi:hypothetical protein